jgi:hypothetical protein
MVMATWRLGFVHPWIIRLLSYKSIGMAKYDLQGSIATLWEKEFMLHLLPRDRGKRGSSRNNVYLDSDMSDKKLMGRGILGQN